MILAVDTSTEFTSVALFQDDAAVIERRHRDARRHAEVIAPLLAEVLADVDRREVTAIACGVGPGPYTGLRVGIAAARALGLSWSVPVFGLCSLDAIAAAWHSANPGEAFAVASDARRREVYWAAYDARGAREHGPRVNAPQDLGGSSTDGVPGGSVRTWLGHGAALHAEVLGGVQVGVEDESALAFPAASWIGRRVGALVEAGVTPVDADLALDRHGEDGSATARALAGATLLAPLPLYLRRADTTERTSA